MKVKIKQWNGVASWLWVANDENCGICRMSFNGCCPDCKLQDSWFALLSYVHLCVWIPVIINSSLKGRYLFQVRCLVTTAHWSGGSVLIVSTCTASWSGWTHSRCSSNVLCAARNGSSKNDISTPVFELFQEVKMQHKELGCFKPLRTHCPCILFSIIFVLLAGASLP